MSFALKFCLLDLPQISNKYNALDEYSELEQTWSEDEDSICDEDESLKWMEEIEDDIEVENETLFESSTVISSPSANKSDDYLSGQHSLTTDSLNVLFHMETQSLNGISHMEISCSENEELDLNDFLEFEELYDDSADDTIGSVLMNKSSLKSF